MDLTTFSPFLGPMGLAMKAVQSTYERTPRLAAYLPGIFHEEAEKKLSPLWALLLLIEDNFDSISKIIDKIDQYFDIWRAPAGTTGDEPDFVTWLGSWVALVPEQDWPEQKKRYALGIAAHLHKYRGTITGLRCMLSLFFEIEVEIKEWTWPEGMRTGVNNTIDVDTRIDDRYNINHCFTVTWKPKPGEIGPDLKQKLADIRAMMDREKPAHTFCYFNVIGYEE
jgi:phage tail-like protein